MALTEKESDELFQFLMEGAVRKLINCMVAEGNTEEEIVHELKRIQKEYKKENTPEGVIMTATEETLRKIVRAGQDYLRKALENNPSIADSVCRKMNVVEAAKFLPEGKTHIIEPLTNKELAIWVETLFLKESKCDCKGEKETAEQILLRKEIAYQVIQRLTENEEVKENLIRSEKDWRRYLQIERQDYHK